MPKGAYSAATRERCPKDRVKIVDNIRSLFCAIGPVTPAALAWRHRVTEKQDPMLKASAMRRRQQPAVTARPSKVARFMRQSA